MSDMREAAVTMGGATSAGKARALELWGGAALLALVPISIAIGAAIPIFTVLWIAVPLALVARSGDGGDVGFKSVSRPLLVRTAAINLALVLGIMLAVEPWSHTYEKLVDLAISSDPLDSSFAWLVRLPRPQGLAAMAAYTGLVTMFGEELFFRGWLLQLLVRRKMPVPAAIVLQATIFTLPQLIAAAVLPPVQGILYAVAYSWLSIGVVGGWAAARTGSIWPGLFTATIANLLFVAFAV